VREPENWVHYARRTKPLVELNVFGNNQLFLFSLIQSRLVNGEELVVGKPTTPNEWKHGRLATTKKNCQPEVQ